MNHLFNIAIRFIIGITSFSSLSHATIGAYPMTNGTSSLRNVFQPRRLEIGPLSPINEPGACFIDDYQNLRCVGKNTYGNIGDGTTTDRSTPVNVLAHVASVAAKNPSSTCALLTNGTVKCWGSNSWGQLGNGTSTSSLSPTTASIQDVIQLEVTDLTQSYFALKANGEVYGWGRAFLGNGNTIGSNTPVKVLLPSTFIATKIRAGLYANCAMGVFVGTSDYSNRIYCWSGAVDDGSHTPVAIDFPGAVLDINPELHTSIAALVRESGVNKVYQYDYTTSTASLLADFASYDVVSIFGNSDSHFAITKSGVLLGVGENSDCQLGDGTTTDRTSAVTISGVSNAVRVFSAGDPDILSTFPDSRMWALQADGTLKHWSGYSAGCSPVAISSTTYPVRRAEDSLSAGHKHSCAVTREGTVKCWGYNFTGAVGDGTTTNRNTPTLVSGLSNVIQVKTGTWSSYALKGDGTVSAWGYNWMGDLGDNTTTQRTSPVAVSGLSGVVSLAAATTSACALLFDGTVKCWGEGSDGRLGHGTTTESHVPVTVLGVSDAVGIFGTDYHYCALLSGGRAKCWGSNDYNEISTSGSADISTPVSADFAKPFPLTGIYKAKSLSLGQNTTCAVIESGTIRCRGNNQYGQLGNGTTTNSSTGVTVSGISKPHVLSSRGQSACSILSDGNVNCWGYNSYSQLGDGTTTNRSSPVSITANYSTSISNGINHTIFRGYKNTIIPKFNYFSILSCGYNGSGAIGDGTFTNRATPVGTSF